jgi:hypothetical protein
MRKVSGGHCSVLFACYSVNKRFWKGFMFPPYNRVHLYNAIIARLVKKFPETQGSLTKLTPWNRVVLEKLRVRSASQETPRILWNPKAHHRVHNSPPPVPILSQINPIHIPKPYFPKIRLVFLVVSSLQASQLKCCMHISPPPSWVPHAPPISSSLLWSP